MYTLYITAFSFGGGGGVVMQSLCIPLSTDWSLDPFSFGGTGTLCFFMLRPFTRHNCTFVLLSFSCTSLHGSKSSFCALKEAKQRKTNNTQQSRAIGTRTLLPLSLFFHFLIFLRPHFVPIHFPICIMIMMSLWLKSIPLLILPACLSSRIENEGLQLLEKWCNLLRNGDNDL